MRRGSSWRRKGGKIEEQEKAVNENEKEEIERREREFE